MVETMVTGEVIILLLIAFLGGYLTCSTIMLGDLELKNKELKEKFEKVKEEKEYLEDAVGYTVYRDVA